MYVVRAVPLISRFLKLRYVNVGMNGKMIESEYLLSSDLLIAADTPACCC